VKHTPTLQHPLSPIAANAIAGDDVPGGDEGAGGNGVSRALAAVGRGLGVDGQALWSANGTFDLAFVT